MRSAPSMNIGASSQPRSGCVGASLASPTTRRPGERSHHRRLEAAAAATGEAGAAVTSGALMLRPGCQRWRSRGSAARLHHYCQGFANGNGSFSATCD
jgi:hypothetical protein